MSKPVKDIETHALEELREYLIFNNIEIKSKDQLMNVYLKMFNEGYYYKATIYVMRDDVRKALKNFANAYEENHDVLDKELIFFGAKKAIAKMRKMKR